MLKRNSFIFGLFILCSCYNANGQCCCEIGGTPFDSPCDFKVLCDLFGGTWYNTPCSTVPIELVYFHARVEDGRVVLTWKTAAEIDNDFFTIERSPDGLNWEAVEQIQGAGNSSEIRIYEARDDQPFLGLSYYRLKQTDFDGAYSYSSMVPVQVITDKPYKIYPNPATDHITIIFDSDDNTKIRITDQLGREVTSEMIQGARSMRINTSGLSKGMYLFYIIRDDNRFVEKVMLR